VAEAFDPGPPSPGGQARESDRWAIALQSLTVKLHGACLLLLQVGKDKGAQAFLGQLDKHPEVGSR
jgi:hypothetical protein